MTVHALDRTATVIGTDYCNEEQNYKLTKQLTCFVTVFFFSILLIKKFPAMIESS
jgi:hypothetical protein